MIRFFFLLSFLSLACSSLQKKQKKDFFVCIVKTSDFSDAPKCKGQKSYVLYRFSEWFRNDPKEAIELGKILSSIPFEYESGKAYFTNMNRKQQAEFWAYRYTKYGSLRLQQQSPEGVCKNEKTFN